MPKRAKVQIVGVQINDIDVSRAKPGENVAVSDIVAASFFFKASNNGSRRGSDFERHGSLSFDSPLSHRFHIQSSSDGG